uniref:adenylate cyclase type 9-like isoform X1 n=1 Tax=Styela clava TaxID=7725 RepID=UPI00193A8D24|nr:adenylate cyclase type 9-like isoform X1 [Styela clava]
MTTTMVEFNLKSNENNVSLVSNQEKKEHSETNKSDLSPCRITMLSRRKKRGRIPHLFERSSKKWWNPQMDSEILEKQCLDFSLEQSIWYFQLALVFIMVACIVWIIYFGSRQQPDEWIAGVSWASVLTIICIMLFVVTKKTKFYKKFSCYIAIGVAVILILTVLLAAFFSSVIMTSVGSFFLASEVILLLYTVMPLPLHINFALGLAFSFAYEIIYRIGLWEATPGDIIAHIFLHLCIHVIGVQICLNLQVRRRSTFWKVGQIIKSNQSIEVEQNFKKVMIDSIMPPSVSDKLMEGKGGREMFVTTAKEEGKFRPLYVERMENVSILYADIVGFTKMSANKSAATLVYLLNDLFGRFDALCLKTECEKISTLGDCYYCVAGCPDPKPDHAKCCVEMGLGMIDAIKRFCTDNDVNVNMRIGIHTGIVICGIVGMKRFKFDVWSNDVSFANHMEQWGVPGRIHVSQSTRDCLGDLYEIEDGKIEERAPAEVVAKGIKTYLIVDRPDSDTSSISGESSTSSTSQNGDVIDQVDQKAQEMVSVENETKSQPNGVRVEDTTVIIKTPQDNGGAQQATDDNQQDGSMIITNNKVGIVGENTGEDNNTVNGTYDHESTLQTDPLLSVKRTSTRNHHHHSSRYKSRRRHEAAADDPNSKQNQILGWYVLPLLNAASQSSVRVKQDSEFVDTIKNDPRMKNINNNEPLEPVSMRFIDPKIETEYRNKFHNEVENDEEITSFVSARFSFMLDLLISFIVFALVSFASLADFGFRAAWCIVFVVVFIIMGFVVYIVFNYVFNIGNVPGWVKGFSGWVPRHFLGVICLACPAAMVFSNMFCHSIGSPLPPDCATYLIIMGIVLIHFLNFNQLSSWIRSVIASIIAISITLLVYLNPCGERLVTTGNSTTNIITTNGLCLSEMSKYQYEFIIDILLLMLFIFIVNREYEVGHRLTFFIAHEAEESNKTMEEERNQMDQLLLHIIPPRVQEVIREKNMYSKNHENVGVIFASIINFNEFYEESYAGGKECIRVLNELIGDVDELLDNEKYAEVEKIKTIGSTFMIASGLNPNIEREPNNNNHLCTLMHFCTEVQDVIFEFNENMVCFTFILRIGFNHGSVTAGVIGTTKLLYDIWGDTVNIASRMDSTGVPGKIQVSENSQKCLKDKFDFTYRGSTMVKGKGEMQTYLLHRESDRPIKENPKPTPTNFEGQES